MSVQQFCLRWNNHQPNFISVFSTLLHNESLVDVTLAAEGRHLQAHKVVLSACSSYFQSLFTVNPCQHPIVILKDVKYNDLKTMVDFMYYGEVNVSQEQLPHILKTAEMLKIKGLAEMPDSTSLTKSQSTSLDRAEITPGDSNWGSETHRHSSSPAPMSPASRRKRLRKSSTGSGSLSTERNSEDHPSDLISPTLIKPEPIPFIQSTTLGNLRGSKQDTSTESEAPLESSQESLDEESSNNPHMVHQKSTDSESNISVVQSLGGPSVVEHAGPSVSAGCSQTPTHHPAKIPPMGSKRGRLLMRQPRVKKDSDPSQTPPDIELSSPPNFLSIPVRLERHSSEPAPTPNLLHVPQSSYLMKQHSHPLLSSQSPPPLIQRQMSHPQSSSTPLHVQYIAAALKSEHNTQRTPSPTVVMVSERDSSLALPVYESTVRVRSDELRRSASSPHNFSPREVEVTENPRSSHCPVVRPGPALGCNFCWNTIDGHGRILRRKTKYHCPECQTNLCIVPCFQEYHERQAQDNGHTDLAGKNPSVPPSSTVFKPYTKTGSF